MASCSYIALREELLVELEKVLAIESLPSKTRGELQQICQRLRSKAFNIVLSGGHGGGKSTTFNAICDGREIVPRGAMSGRCACKISAQNLFDPDVEEYAELEWKQHDELLSMIIDLIEPCLRHRIPERFGAMCASEMVHNLRLSKSEDVVLIKACLEDEWEKYKLSPSDYDREETGKLDVLYISRLIVEYCGREEYAHIFSNDTVEDQCGNKEPVHTKIPVADLEKYIHLPHHWAERWLTKGAKSFSANEVAFAFLRSVMCHLHSPTLAKLGCVISECPGLLDYGFTSCTASESDQTMLEADAILYFVNGSRTLSNYDLIALKNIQNICQDHKLFIVINAKGKRDLLKSTIIPADLSFLRNAGFMNVNPDNLYVLNSLLGLCSRNGDAIKKGCLDSVSAERFVRAASWCDDSYPHDLVGLWPMVVEDNLRLYLSREEFARKNLYIDDCMALGDISGLNALLDAVETTIVRNKAEALLVSGGCRQIESAMNMLEGELNAKARMASESAATLTVWDAFAKDATTRIDTILEPQKANALVYDFFENVIVARIGDIAEEFSERFTSNIRSFLNIFKSLKKASLEARLNPLLKDSVLKVTMPTLKGWLKNVLSGDNIVCNDTLFAERRFIAGYLNVRLKDLDVGGLVHGERLGDLESGFADEFRDLPMRLSAIVSYLTFAPTCAAVIGIIPMALLLTTTVFTIVSYNRCVAKIRCAVRDKLRTELCRSFARPDVKAKLLDLGRGFVAVIQKQICAELKLAIEMKRMAYEERCKKVAWFSSPADTTQLLSSCALQTKHIEHLRAWCEKFEKHVMERSVIERRCQRD